MNHHLQEIARILVGKAKGILAADETVPTLTHRFDALGNPFHRTKPAHVSGNAIHRARRGRVHQRRHHAG
jgi:hypothetical protein